MPVSLCSRWLGGSSCEGCLERPWSNAFSSRRDFSNFKSPFPNFSPLSYVLSLQYLSICPLFPSMPSSLSILFSFYVLERFLWIDVHSPISAYLYLLYCSSLLLHLSTLARAHAHTHMRAHAHAHAHANACAHSHSYSHTHPRAHTCVQARTHAHTHMATRQN